MPIVMSITIVGAAGGLACYGPTLRTTAEGRVSIILLFR